MFGNVPIPSLKDPPENLDTTLLQASLGRRPQLRTKVLLDMDL